MQWLDQGRYDLGPFHPPLARIAMAVGPYLYGLRSQGVPDRWKEGNAILHSRGKYAVALTLARIGILPFFALAATCLCLWSPRVPGARALGGLTAEVGGVPLFGRPEARAARFGARVSLALLAGGEPRPSASAADPRGSHAGARPQSRGPPRLPAGRAAPDRMVVFLPA